MTRTMEQITEIMNRNFIEILEICEGQGPVGWFVQTGVSGGVSTPSDIGTLTVTVNELEMRGYHGPFEDFVEAFEFGLSITNKYLVEAAIRDTLVVWDNPEFQKWAEAWLNQTNRSDATVVAATHAAVTEAKRFHRVAKSAWLAVSAAEALNVNPAGDAAWEYALYATEARIAAFLLKANEDADE